MHSKNYFSTLTGAFIPLLNLTRALNPLLKKSSIVLTFTLLFMTPALTAYAAPGDTESDPFVCTTFAQFKAAMESTTVKFIQLNNVSEVLPDLSEYGFAILQAVGTTKTLILNGAATFYSSGSGNHAGLIWVTGTTTTLNIKGSGSLTFKASMSGALNAVIYNNGGTVNVYSGTLEGSHNTAVYGRAIWQDGPGSTLNIYGGTLTGTNTNSSNTGISALLLTGSALSSTVNIYGGEFLFTNVATGTGKGLDVDNSFSGTVKIYGGFFAYNTTGEITPYLASSSHTASPATVGGVSGVRVTGANPYIIGYC